MTRKDFAIVAGSSFLIATLSKIIYSCDNFLDMLFPAIFLFVVSGFTARYINNMDNEPELENNDDIHPDDE